MVDKLKAYFILLVTMLTFLGPSMIVSLAHITNSHEELCLQIEKPINEEENENSNKEEKEIKSEALNEFLKIKEATDHKNLSKPFKNTSHGIHNTYLEVITPPPELT